MSRHYKIITSVKNITSFYRDFDIFKDILEQDIKSPSLQSITLLPNRWNKDYLKVSQNTEIEFGIITLLGWISYTIFDHMIDGQHDILRAIPFGERCMRELHWRLASTCKNYREKELCKELLSLIETAHRAECTHKVPPAWHKSAGHMITPLLITMRLGHNRKSMIFKESKKYFIEYLTIKQFSDDLRDWEEDLKEGRKTVVTEYLQKLIAADKNKKCLYINFQKIRDKYINNVFKYFCKIIIYRGNKALKSLRNAGLHRDAQHFHHAITRLQTGAQNALDQIKIIEDKKRKIKTRFTSSKRMPKGVKRV